MNTSSRRFPAEWEKQEGILLSFPHNGNDWPGKYQVIQWALIEYIKKVSTYEMVFLVVAHEKLKAKVLEMMDLADVNRDRVSFIIQRTNRSWMRDSGPIIVKNNGKREAIQFNFTGWAKYSNHRLDRNVPPAVANHLNIPLTQAIYRGKHVVMEGGAIETNGKGTLITSEECLLHPSIQIRNKGFSREDYENIFAEYLGISNVIWMGDGIVGDDTHGHIDDLCRFVNEDTVVTVVESNPKDENFSQLQDNLKRLKKSRLENGKSLNIVELPMPEKLIFEGIRLPASYANFLIINNSVLVPVFNDANDRIALNILDQCFPNRKIIPISAIDLIWGFGTLHCLSQQIPE